MEIEEENEFEREAREFDLRLGLADMEDVEREIERIKRKQESFELKLSKLSHDLSILWDKLEKAEKVYNTMFEKLQEEGKIKLTPRQKEILDLAKEGYTPTEIAEKLGTTVQNVTNIMRALRNKGIMI